MEQWERDDLVGNFVTLISEASREVQERMVWHFLLVKEELGIRVGDGGGGLAGLGDPRSAGRSSSADGRPG